MAGPGDAFLKGRYCVKRLLHRGGFSFIYLARDNFLGKDVVLKELIPTLADDSATLKRFICEAQATSHLTHPNIVRTLNVFTDWNNYYIAMEYLPGGSLEELLRERGRLSLDEAVPIVADICAGLNEAHIQGVYHCDLKPGNILFDENGVAKLADFGIAHVSGALVARSWRTARDFSSGTLFYMPPEQLDGVRNDPRVDVYALGAVFYQMLSGRLYLPFDRRDTPSAQADNVNFIRHRHPQPLDDLPPEVNVVLMKALAKRPARRYESAAALRSALVQASLPFVTSPRAVMALSPLDSASARPLGLLARHVPPSDRLWLATAATAGSLFLLVAYGFLGRVGSW
jgi:serine/threonine protein kinase